MSAALALPSALLTLASGGLVGLTLGLIGGGFLIVPSIMLGSGMPILNAAGSSLFAVGAFGLTTAASYGLDGLVDWRLAALLIGGGVAGGLLGLRLALRLAARRGVLTRLFAVVLFLVAGYMLVDSLGA